jgi:flagellar hook-length control protein FliK
VALHPALDHDAAVQPELANLQTSALVTSTSAVSTSSSAQSAGAEPLAGAEPKPTYAEFMQSSNQQEQQNAANSQSKPEQPTFTADGMTQSLHDVPAATVDVATSRQAAPMAEIASTSPTSGLTAASSHAVHTHVNKLTDTLKTAEMTPSQQALDLQQPTAASKLLERVMYQVQQKIQSAEVQLHPEDLGAMQIKLSLQQDQVTVQFLVQNGAAKDAVEQQLSRLKDMLQQQGMQLADGQVEQRQQGQQGDSSQRQSNRTAHASQNDAEQVGVVQQGQVQVRISERAVDYYA